MTTTQSQRILDSADSFGLDSDRRSHGASLLASFPMLDERGRLLRAFARVPPDKAELRLLHPLARLAGSASATSLTGMPRRGYWLTV
jgi:hypothetical protein